MYSLHLTCAPDEVDLVSADLWEQGTVGVREIDSGDRVILIAGFENNERRLELLALFASFSPEWEQEDATDWVLYTQESWPARAVGEKLFLAPPWAAEETPAQRVRLIHNPGLACGTGEHPCTQLALVALERFLPAGAKVVDVGTGSGIVAIAASLLGAVFVVGLDTDAAALEAAAENFALNSLQPALLAGSADCIAEGFADVTIANINGSVLLSILDDLLALTKPGGVLVLTGFTESELPYFENLFPNAEISGMNEWQCVAVRISAPA